MKRLLFIICALLFVSAGAFAQVGAYSSTATDSFGKRISSPTVKVCAVTDSACSTPVTIYKDSSSTSLSNPFTGDTQGNYTFFAAPGNYTVQVAKSGYSAYSYPASIGNTARECGGANTYCTNPALDAGMDECTAINAAWPYAVAKGWSGIRVISGWTGTQHCSASMFASFPFNFAGSASLSARVELHPSNTVQTDKGEVIPASTTLWGGSNGGVGVGAAIQATNAFYAQVPVPPAVVQFGAPDGTTFTGSTPPEGVWVEHINIIGRPTGAAAGSYTPVACLLNQYAQENSGAEFIFFDGCVTGLDLENGGTLNGALNSGSYKHLRFNFDGINSANAHCITAGATTSNLGAIRAIEDYSCNLSGDVVQPTSAITIDSESTSLVDGHIEGFVNGVVVGANHPARNFSLDKLSVVSFAGNPMSNAVLISASNTSSGTIKNVKGGGSISSLKLLTNNLTGETPIDGSTSNAVVTNYAWPAPPTPVSSLSGSTANTSVPLNSFSLNFTGANSVLNLATNGDVQLTPVALATSGGSVGSFKFLQQGSCWNGSVAVADNYAPNIAYAGGTNPSGTWSWTHTGGCGGNITFDVSNFFRFKYALLNTSANCSSSASPAVCAAASAGSVNIPAAATTITVNTTAVTASSQIQITEDSSLGTKLSVTCNTTAGRTYMVTARTAGVSFTITTSAAPTTNPACLSYAVIN